MSAYELFVPEIRQCASMSVVSAKVGVVSFVANGGELSPIGTSHDVQLTAEMTGTASGLISIDGRYPLASTL